MKVPSLLSVQWLAQALLKTRPSIPMRVVDATWRLADGSSKAHEDYLESHIPGAVFFDIDECCDKSSEFPHMLPSEKLFAEYVAHLGITNDSHVVVYENNEEFGLFSSPRLWWTFRCFGHNTISVLNGGFSKWVDDGLPVNSGQEEPPNVNQPYKAKLNQELVRDFQSMVANVKSGGKMHQVVDARAAARFRGTGEEPRPGVSVGHIPYAANVPFVECLDKDEHMMKDAERLKQVFAEHGVDLSEPFTATCGSAVTACVLALAAHECGQGNVSVYDGSWAEWGRRAPSDMVEKN